MLLSTGWTSYELLDTAHGEKLERWGEVILRRPDPQVIWPEPQLPELWKKVDGVYHRSEKGGGQWEFKRGIPENWMVDYKGLKFGLKAMGFKHTGVFPEQSVNWEWMMEKLKMKNEKLKKEEDVGSRVSVLNLFGYTGGATLACAKAGATVCHVDAAKGMVTRARLNAELSGLGKAPIRYICDDALAFVDRELRRGRTYDAIIMDPPSFGRGPSGEVWKLEDELFNLVNKCSDLLSNKPSFFVINSYTTGLQPSVLRDVLELTVVKKRGGVVMVDEIGIPVSQSKIVLPAGSVGRVSW